MKTIIKTFTFIILIFYVTACAGYKPVFVKSNLNFEISDYSIIGDKTLGKELYSKLRSLSKSKKDNGRKIIINIDVIKNKVATAKNSAGQILEYRISLNTKIEIKDFLNGSKLLTHNFSSSSSYSVQDQYSETVTLENKNIENLLNKNFLDLLIKMSEKII